MAINETNGQGYGKPKKATWFFEAPWQAPLLGFCFTHHSAFKMTQIMNKHGRGDFHTFTETVYQQCLAGQAHNPGKISFAPRGHTPVPSRPSQPSRYCVCVFPMG